VKLVDATPDELVLEEVGETVPPPSTAAQLTATPDTGTPPSPVTSTDSCMGRRVPAGALCSSPPEEAICVGGVKSAVAVAVKVTGDPSRSLTTACTCCCPSVDPRVNSAEATPSGLLVDETGETLPPPSITDQLTTTSRTGVPSSAVTFTDSAAGRRLPGKAF
jgi:hypothetical protein